MQSSCDPGGVVRGRVEMWKEGKVRRYRLADQARICEGCGCSYFPRRDKVAVSRFCSRRCQGLGHRKNMCHDGSIGLKHGRYTRERIRESKREDQRTPAGIAQRRAYKAKQQGKLVPRPCQICGTTAALHMHHTDYKRPLDVVWLCALHHKRVHMGKVALA